MQQKGEVAVLLRRHCIALKALVMIIVRSGPRWSRILSAEQWIGNSVVELFQRSGLIVGKLRGCQGIALFDIGIGKSACNHIFITAKARVALSFS